MKITHAPIDSPTQYDRLDELEANAFYVDSDQCLVLTDCRGEAFVVFGDDSVYPGDDANWPLYDTKIKKVTLEL